MSKNEPQGFESPHDGIDDIAGDVEAGAEQLARAIWNGRDYSIDEVDEWDAIGRHHYPLGATTTAGDARSSTERPGARVVAREEEIEHTTINVSYSASGVTLDAEAEGYDAVDENIRAGLLVELTPSEAIDLAARLSAAAIERTRREVEP